MKIYKLVKFIIYFLIFILYAQKINAAPPFLTDDASPASRHQWQIYPFSYAESATSTTTLLFPALEIDYGFLPHTEWHLIVSTLTFSQSGQRNSGINDTELGFKYRFIQETASMPAVAIAPALELPTGNAQRFLGNGRLWTKLPIWLQKNFGAWTTYGGGGFGFNSAPGTKNYLYGGWLLQRNFNEQLSLGAEIFSQGATGNTAIPPFQDTGAVTLINVGGSYNVRPNLAVLFAAGHSLIGAKQWVGFFGFYWNLQG